LIVSLKSWELVLKKGYQASDQVSSTVTTKVKGLGYLNNTINLNDHKYNIYDTSDYVIPPNEYNSIFVMTNFIETQQSRGICEEVNFRNNKKKPLELLHDLFLTLRIYQNLQLFVQTNLMDIA
jgi:hypothetical protein